VAAVTRVRVVVYHTMPTPLLRSTKLKISHWYFDQCLHPIKTTSSVKHISSKRFSTYFLSIHLTRCLSSMVNLIAVTTLLLTCCLQCCKQRIFSKNTSYFHAVRISISLAILFVFSIKFVTFSKSHARKQKWMFFFWTQCSATSNNMRLVHCRWWMGCNIWYSGEGTGRGRSPPYCCKMDGALRF